MLQAKQVAKRGLGNCDSRSLCCIIICAPQQQILQWWHWKLLAWEPWTTLITVQTRACRFSIVLTTEGTPGRADIQEAWCPELSVWSWYVYAVGISTSVMVMTKIYHCRESNILEKSYSSVILSLVSVCSMSWVASCSVGDRQLELYTIFTWKEDNSAQDDTRRLCRHYHHETSQFLLSHNSSPCSKLLSHSLWHLFMVMCSYR
jgi:hypothetical protein